MTAVLVAAVLLGPALGAGTVQSYDLGWSPDPRWTPTVLGVGVPAPRMVPSDAAGVLLGHLVGAAVAQKLVLMAVLVLAGAGCAALVGTLVSAGAVARCVAAVVALWNPYVGERLLLGQWTVLLGYAVVPWLLREAVLAQREPRRTYAPLAGWVLLAGVGGGNSVVVALVAAVPALLAGGRPRRVAVALAVAAGVGAAWWLPTLVQGVGGADGAGTAAFRPVADAPGGVLVSLLTGGGVWNSAVPPVERGSAFLVGLALVVVVLAWSALVWSARRPDRRAPVVAGVFALLVCLVSALGWTEGAWSAVLDGMPGGGLLRDTQKLLAAWVVGTAAGAGVLVQQLRRRLPSTASAAPLAAVVLTLVVLLTLPSLAWGRLGQLSAEQVDPGLRSGARVLSEAPAGTVGVLPWNQYRRYDWNHSRLSLSLLVRMVDQPLLYDDSLPLRGGRVPGEDPRSRRVSQRIDRGRSPVDALAAEGVRYVAVERDAGAPEPALPAGARRLVDNAELVVIDLAPGAPATSPERSRSLGGGWAITLLTGAAVAGLGARSLRRDPRERIGARRDAHRT